MRRALFRDEPVQLAQIWVLPHDVDWRQDWRRPSPLAARWRRSGEGGSMAIKREAPLAARWRGREHGMQSSVRLELGNHVSELRGAIFHFLEGLFSVTAQAASDERPTCTAASLRAPGYQYRVNLVGHSQGVKGGTEVFLSLAARLEVTRAGTELQRLQGFKASRLGTQVLLNEVAGAQGPRLGDRRRR